MVSQDKQADFIAPRSISTSSIHSIGGGNSTKDSIHHLSINSTDKNSPDFYIEKISESDMKGATPQLVAHLAVSLRTMPLSWVRKFIELKGLQIITSVLGAINIRDQKTEADLQMEAEILKCFKSLINNRWGAREVISHPQCIFHIVLSLVSPPIQTRKLVCEILAFVCHVDLPKGQDIVLKGLDKLSEHLGEFGRFDAWFKLLEATLDGRGKMGSLVGASEDVKRLAGSGAPDSHLSDFALSNMMLVNSLVTVIEDVEIRVHLRNQLNASGLDSIMEKMLQFNNEQLKRHITIYKQMSENDVDEIMEIYNETILTSMNDPRACFERILERVEGTRSYNFFLSALQHLLMIQAQGDIQVRYFQIIDKLITQVAMDRKGVGHNDLAAGGSMGWSVGMLIDKFAEQDQLNAALKEAKEAKKMYENAIKEKQELETEINLKGDGLIGILRDKTNSLEDLLRMSRHTIATLQRKLKDAQQEYELSIAALDQQLREIYIKAADANQKDGVAEDGQNGHFVLGREEVTRAYDRLKAQAILEGKPEQNEDVSLK
ncbi:MAG: armadillo-type protein [Benjaminiella poitrasii]|nr:MAG: armadillo-type protein [Benjaminiella poitrasii]